MKEKAVDALKITIGFWRSFLAVMVLGILAVLINYGVFFTFILCAIGAFIFHMYEEKYKVFREFMSRLSIATMWTLLIEFTSVGQVLVRI